MQFLTLLRHLDGLRALFSRRKPVADFGGLLTAADDGAAWEGLYEVVERPWPDMSAALVPDHAALLAAWNALAAVPPPFDAAVAPLIALLRETVADAGEPSEPPPLRRDSAPMPAAPTAAHPRAYRGTTYQPPKRKSAPAEDLRPYLFTPKGLAALAERLPEAADILQAAAADLRLPPLFRTHLLTQARRHGPEFVNHLLALFWSLDLPAHPSLLASAARLLLRAAPETTLDWLDLAAALPADRRALLLDLVLETEADAPGGRALGEADRCLVLETAQGAYPASRLFSLLRALRRGVSADYVAAGFRLSGADDAASLRRLDWDKIAPDAHYPEAALEQAYAHWATASDWYGFYPGVFWRECGQLAHLGHVLEAMDWRQYPPDISFQYARFYADFTTHDGTPEQVAEAFAVIERHVPLFEALMRDTPTAYHAKLIKNLKGFWWAWENAATFERCFPPLDALLRRLCRPPFALARDLDDCGADFLEFLDPAQTQQFLDAPDACFHHVERACRRGNDAALCGFGTYTLAQADTDWLLNAFLLHPAKLFKVCKTLGCFSHAQRKRLVAESDFQTVDIPPPRLLREHEAGQRRLPAAQLAHYQEAQRRSVMLAQLEKLEGAALSLMAGEFGVGAENEGIKHALQIQYDAEENRPALRRFLKAHWNGQTNYLQSHPRTQAWLRRHPKVNADLWQQGISYAVASPRYGPLTLSVEQDPLEVLRLGTYVGSCLGLGGGLSYSAAAAVLDINKQVVYARRADGSVLARQLLAVSDDDSLIAFYVYPLGVAAEVQRHFSEYDRRFAEALGLPLRRDETEEDADIETILAHRWWHDMQWKGKGGRTARRGRPAASLRQEKLPRLGEIYNGC